jgi:Protein of unknown function (DUF4241)
MSLWSRLFGKKPREPEPAPDPATIARAFEVRELGALTFDVVRVGELEVPTGRIVACDPLVFPEASPFTRTIARGRHPVEIAIARVSADDGRCAAARLLARATPVTRWEPAMIEGEELAPGDLPGYGVDAGLGCFMDAACRHTFLAAQRSVKDNYYDDVLARELDRKRFTVDWTLHVPDATKPDNVAIFSSGWGDGFYTTYVGLGESGEVVCLLTDFGIIESS